VIDLILNKVLTIIVIGNFIWDFDSLVGFNGDLELVATRLSVLTFIITGLDNELNWLTDGLILKDTRTISK
jgi:hypothetical protein